MEAFYVSMSGAVIILGVSTYGFIILRKDIRGFGTVAKRGSPKGRGRPSARTTSDSGKPDLNESLRKMPDELRESIRRRADDLRESLRQRLDYPDARRPEGTSTGPGPTGTQRSPSSGGGGHLPSYRCRRERGFPNRRRKQRPTPSSRPTRSNLS